MRMWLMKEGNAYWNSLVHEWTSAGMATEYTDSQVEQIELTGDAKWVIAYPLQ